MRFNVRVSGNPVWVHVLKLGKVVDEIAEHVVEKHVRLGISIQRRAAVVLYATPFLLITCTITQNYMSDYIHITTLSCNYMPNYIDHYICFT